MQTVELETVVDKEGRIQIPNQYRHFYGQSVRLVVSALDALHSGSNINSFFSQFNSDPTCDHSNLGATNEDFATLFASLEHFPADYMIKGREQLSMQERVAT